MEEKKNKSVTGTKNTKKKGTSKSNQTKSVAAKKKTTTKKVSMPKKDSSAKKFTPEKKVSSTKKPDVKKITKQEKNIEEIKPLKKEPVKEEVSLPKKDIEIVPEKLDNEDKGKYGLPLENPFKPSKLHLVMILLAFICMAVYLGVLFFDKVSVPYSDYWKDKSFLLEKNIVPSVSCEQISNIIQQEQAFIYIKNSTSEEEFNLEKSLKNIIQDYHLDKKFYVYELNPNCGSLSSLDSIISRNLNLSQPIYQVPTILYYKKGIFVDSVKRIDQSMMNDGDFVQLLDIYEIKK